MAQDPILPHFLMCSTASLQLHTALNCLAMQSADPVPNLWCGLMSQTGLRDLLQILHTDASAPSQPSMSTTATNAFANTSLQDYLHSRDRCPLVQHVISFLKRAPLRINEQIYLQSIENAKENMMSKIQGTEPNQISSR